MRRHAIELVRSTVKAHRSIEDFSLDEICFSLGLDVGEAVLPNEIEGA